MSYETLSKFAQSVLEGVTVRRTNGQCEHGPRYEIAHEDVPAWVPDAVADEIAESDLDSGEVSQGGDTWTWRKAD